MELIFLNKTTSFTRVGDEPTGYPMVVTSWPFRSRAASSIPSVGVKEKGKTSRHPRSQTVPSRELKSSLQKGSRLELRLSDSHPHDGTPPILLHHLRPYPRPGTLKSPTNEGAREWAELTQTSDGLEPVNGSGSSPPVSTYHMTCECGWFTQNARLSHRLIQKHWNTEITIIEKHRKKTKNISYKNSVQSGQAREKKQKISNPRGMIRIR